MHKPDAALSGANTALTIDFGRYGHILRAIEELADEQVRPIELQALFILKNYFDKGEANHGQAK